MPSNLESPQLLISEIQDIAVRKNFEALKSYFAAQNQLLDFQFIEIDIPAAVTEMRVRHGLNVIPRDLLRLEVTGPGKLTFHRGLFNTSFMIVSATDAVHVRLLAGLHKGSGSAALATNAIEEWRATV